MAKTSGHHRTWQSRRSPPSSVPQGLRSPGLLHRLWLSPAIQALARRCPGRSRRQAAHPCHTRERLLGNSDSRAAFEATLIAQAWARSVFPVCARNGRLMHSGSCCQTKETWVFAPVSLRFRNHLQQPTTRRSLLALRCHLGSLCQSSPRRGRRLSAPICLSEPPHSPRPDAFPSQVESQQPSPREMPELPSLLGLSGGQS